MAISLTSKQPPVTTDQVMALSERLGGLPAALRDLIAQHNVAVPVHPRWLGAGADFEIRHFFGRSAEPWQDLAAVNDFYDGRLAPGHLAVADADGGNLVCMDRVSGHIFYWDHETHDRGDDPDADEPPLELASSLAAFLEALQPPAPPPAATPAPAAGTWKSPDFDTLFKDYKIDE